MVFSKMENYIYGNSILGDSPHGFRKGRSCLTNLLDFFEDATSTMDNCKAYNMVYLDFQKAFDKVPRKRLILKLNAVGIQGNACTLYPHSTSPLRLHLKTGSTSSTLPCLQSPLLLHPRSAMVE
ncbi:UNVERIFIED_CONTAM: hypothetical protein FKN15_066334 [Acipenser sinensis]